MVCWGNVHHVGTRLLQLVHNKARLVDGHGAPWVAERLGDRRELAVAGVFHGEYGGGSQHLQQAAVQVFAAGADDDAVGRHVHAARAVQVRRDGAAKLGQAVERHGAQQVVGWQRKGFAHVAAPHRRGEQRHAGAVCFQVHEKLGVRRLPDDVRCAWRGGRMGAGRAFVACARRFACCISG